MSANAVTERMISEEHASMNKVADQSPDNWRVTRVDVLDFRNVAMPPAVIERTRTTPTMPRDGRVMAVDGERRALARIVSTIASARTTIVAGAFLFSSPELEAALMDAARRGVRVYLLVASENRLLKEPKADSEFDQDRFEEHKQLLDRLAGWVFIRTAADWHAKIVLVDDGPEGSGFLLTANLTAEALSRNEELVVELGRREQEQAREVARWVLWSAAQHEVVEPGKLRAVSPVAGVAKPAVEGPLVATLQDGGSLRRAILDVIASSQQELIVASYGWDSSHPAVAALCSRARAGCKVTVLARARPASMPALLELAQAGARVLIFRWLHAKAVWSDAGRAVVTTANLEPQGLDRGIELGVVLDDERATELHGVLQGWAARAAHELRVGASLGEALGKASLWRSGKFEEVEIRKTVAVNPEEIIAASADRLEPPPLGPVDVSALPRPLAHEHVLTRTVMAPILDPRSKPTDGDGTWTRPQLFRDPKGRVVVAIDAPEQLDAARALAAAHGDAPIVVDGSTSS